MVVVVSHIFAFQRHPTWFVTRLQPVQIYTRSQTCSQAHRSQGIDDVTFYFFYVLGPAQAKN